jgi:Mg-chelatase subunit ChlD
MSKLPLDRRATPAWVKRLEQASGRSLNEDRRASIFSTGGVVILAVDCSGSMAGSKIDQARTGALNFGGDALRRGYLVGAVQFGSMVGDLLAPTNSEEGLKKALEKIRIDGSTNMSAGIDRAVVLLGARGIRIICIVTDGMPDNVEETIRSAALARSVGIEIMVVGTDDADWTFLSQMVSRVELATKVDAQKLGLELAKMAKLLPQLPPSKR